MAIVRRFLGEERVERIPTPKTLSTIDFSLKETWHGSCSEKKRGLWLRTCGGNPRPGPLVTLLRISGLQDRASTRSRRKTSAGSGPFAPRSLRRIRLALISAGIAIIACGCALYRMESRFSLFARMSETMGEGLEDVYVRVMNGEWELRYRESGNRERIHPRDLEPRVFNEKRRRNREHAGRYLAAYPALLLTLVKMDATGDLDKQADRVSRDLVTLQQGHPDWITPSLTAVAAGLVATIPHAVRGWSTARLLKNIMTANEPVITELCRQLAADMADCRIWVERCYGRRFRLEVSGSWPQDPARRIKTAKTGMRLLRERDQLLALLDRTMAALPELSAAHADLLRRIRAGRGAWPALCRLAEAMERMGGCLEACRSGD